MERRKVLDPAEYQSAIDRFRDQGKVPLEFEDLLLVPSGIYTNFRCPLRFRKEGGQIEVVCEPLSFKMAHLTAGLVAVAVIGLVFVLGKAVLSPALLASLFLAIAGCVGAVYGLTAWVNRSLLPRNPLLLYDKATDEVVCHNGSLRVPRRDIVCVIAARSQPQGEKFPDHKIRVSGVTVGRKKAPIRHEPLHLQVKLVYESPETLERKNFVIEKFMGGRVNLFDDVFKPFAKHFRIPYVHCEFDGGMREATLTRIV